MTARTVRWLTEDQAGKRAAQAASGKERERVRAEVLPFLLPEEAEQVEVDADVQGAKAVLRLYDVIDSWGGWWGISASEVVEALDELPDTVTLVEVHLNSPGGEAMEGVALANVLRQHPARCVCIVDGLAASAASMVAMGCDEVVMAPGSQLMVHAASGGSWGLAEDLERYAQSLRSISGAYAQAYAAKAGRTTEEWLTVMRDETWFAPAEAVAAGLADRLLSAPTTVDPAAAVARHDLRVFAHAGRADAPAPRLPATAAGKTPGAPASGPAAAGGTTAKEARVSETLLTNLRQSLGLAEDADEATVMAEHDKAMAALQDLNDNKPPVASAVPDGHVAIPTVALEELRTQAAQGAAAHRQLHEQNRTAALDGLRDRFLPANRATWEAEYDKNPTATVEYLKNAPVIVPLAELGHSQDAPPLEAQTAATVRESDAYKNWSM